MDEQLFIERENKLPPSQDFNFLRAEAIRFIEKLAGKVWTDYNSSDPGITLIECLCYALTDLGYRSSFDIEDILAPDETRGTTSEKIFYNATEILPCSPVTIKDYRKLIIDTDGVKNAWIEAADDYEVLLYASIAKSSSDESVTGNLDYDSSAGSQPLHLKGLYKVLVEYDYATEAGSLQDEVAKNIRKRLNAHRNLCEDFLIISSVEFEFFTIKAEIQVNEGADIDKICAIIFQLTENLFSSPVKFYTLVQMLEKGSTIEQLFEGPLLKHGFIDNDELAQSGRNKRVHLSDIIKVILNIPGVIAVKKFLFPEDSQSPFSNFTERPDQSIDQKKILRLDVDNSKIIFSRSGDRYRHESEKMPDWNRVKEIYSFLQSAQKDAKLKQHNNELNIPAGEFKDLSEYYPFQHLLPAIYFDMDEVIINITESDGRMRHTTMEARARRERQVRQLKGFLMVFEQIMADYLSQLANLRNIFSFNPQTRQTYYPVPLTNLEDLDLLFKDVEKYKDSLLEITQSEKQYLAKRNLILDHLLARFGENLDKYSFYLHNAKMHAGESLIKAKTAVLSEYLQLSNYRGRSFNFRDPANVWDTPNVPGIKKRIARLTGMSEYQTKNLTSDWILFEKREHPNGVIRYVAVVRDPENHQQILLQSNEYETESESWRILNYLLYKGIDRYNYKQDHQKFRYQLKKENTEREIEYVAEMSFKDDAERESYFDKLINRLEEFSSHENFHCIEHILLRPKIDPQQQTGNTTISSAAIDLLSVSGKPETTGTPEGIGKALPYRFNMVELKDPKADNKTIWRLSLTSLENNRPVEILNIKEDFGFKKDITERIEHLREAGADKENYVKAEDVEGSFIFSIKSGDRILANSSKRYRKEEDREKEIDMLVDYFSFELSRISVQKEEELVDLSEEVDPYSFQVSFFIPDWPARFREPAFKHLLEMTIYGEVPAHIYPNIYWLDYKQMKDFEEVYKPWLNNIATSEIPDTAIVNNLIYVINNLRQTI